MSIFIVIALLGLLSTLSGFGVYFSKLKRNSAPKVPIGISVALVAGFVLGALAISLSSGATLLVRFVVAVPYLINLLMGSIFFFFFLQPKPPLNNIQIRKGEPILPFQSIDNAGLAFLSDNLKGQRFLLKFYRGSWCPYCCAELKMFHEMKSDFDKYDVKTIALSTDDIEQTVIHLKRDKLDMTLLSDPQLTVIKQYGVEHHKALSLDAGHVKKLFGIAFPFSKPSYRSIAIPTSLLVDENGIIQWIDQSEDYRLRASRDNVLSALEKAFSSPLKI